MEEMNTSSPLPFETGGIRPKTPAFPVGKKEICFFAAILISSIALCNFIQYGFNLGFAIASTTCILSSMLYLYAKGLKGSLYSNTMLILCLAICAAFARSDDHFVKFVMVCFLMVSINLGLCLTAKRNRYPTGSVATLLDPLLCLFGLGFGKMSPALSGLKGAFRRSGSFGKKSSSVLLGLAISIPVLAIVLPLLIRADAAFDGLIAKLPNFDLPEAIATLLLGIPLSFVLFSRGTALFHTVQNKAPAETAPRKGLSKLTVNTLLTAICAVYCAYLLSQLAYFVNGFAGILPVGFTAAEYARRGFFEMAWLCAINLGIMVLCVCLVAKDKQAPKSTRLLCLFIGCTTLFFVISAYAKMILYVGIYGLTRLRVLTMVIMTFLAITTVLVSIWLFLPKLPYMKAVILAALVMGAAVIWSDVDTLVARYNVNAYLSGELESIDLDHLNTLGGGAVQYIELLGTHAPDPGIREAALAILEESSCEPPTDFRSWNFTTWSAGTILEDHP